MRDQDVPLPDPLDEVMRRFSEQLNDAMFNGGPDRRVFELRRSILKDEASPEPSLVGLSAWLK